VGLLILHVLNTYGEREIVFPITLRRGGQGVRCRDKERGLGGEVSYRGSGGIGPQAKHKNLFFTGNFYKNDITLAA
jgi:hypothetical protein